MRLPKLSDVAELARALEQHPFGALVLLLLCLTVVLGVWVAKA